MSPTHPRARVALLLSIMTVVGARADGPVTIDGINYVIQGGAAVIGDGITTGGGCNGTCPADLILPGTITMSGPLPLRNQRRAARGTTRASAPGARRGDPTFLLRVDTR